LGFFLVHPLLLFVHWLHTRNIPNSIGIGKGLGGIFEELFSEAA
jgi:hypothetical protein